MTRNNKEKGIKAENYFASRMNQLGLKYSFIDGWYDFNVENNRVEIKSCILTVKQKNNKKERLRHGRFDFTRKEHREKQFKDNIWICFILRHEEDFMLLGFCRARELKKKRYIAINHLRRIKLLSLNQWIGRIM